MAGGLIHRPLRNLTLKRQSDSLALTPGTVNLLLTVKQATQLPGTYPLGPDSDRLKMDRRLIVKTSYPVHPATD